MEREFRTNIEPLIQALIWTCRPSSSLSVLWNADAAGITTVSAREQSSPCDTARRSTLIPTFYADDMDYCEQEILKRDHDMGGVTRREL